MGRPGTETACFIALIFYAALCAGCRREPSSNSSDPASPSIKLTATPPRVERGGTVTVRWIPRNATGCAAADGWHGTKRTDGVETTPPLMAPAELVIDCSGPHGFAHASIRIAAGSRGSSTVFPVHTAPGQRYLLDATDRPLLIIGDSAWSLIATLTAAEVDLHLDDRRKLGFNAILVNLIEHHFSRDPPNNAYDSDWVLLLRSTGSGTFN